MIDLVIDLCNSIAVSLFGIVLSALSAQFIIDGVESLL